jgi:hypothetical protein
VREYARMPVIDMNYEKRWKAPQALLCRKELV